MGDCEVKILSEVYFDEDKYVERRKRLIMLNFSKIKKSIYQWFDCAEDMVYQRIGA